MGPVNLVSCTICSKIINSTVISHSVLFVLVSVVLLPHESQLDSRLTLQVFSNICAGVGLALMVTVTTAVSFYCWAIKKRELGRNRAELFRKNGGLLLQQRFSTITSQGEDQYSAKIFSAEELKAATDNYSESRILG